MPVTPTTRARSSSGPRSWVARHASKSVLTALLLLACEHSGPTAPSAPPLIVVTPANATLAINGVQQYVATGYNASGETVAIVPVWSVVAGGGTISATGLFTAGTALGAFPNTVQASARGAVGQANVTVVAGPLATITVTPNPDTLSVGGTQQFIATGRDAAGNVVPVTPTWSVVAGGGTIGATGLFTAGMVPGTFVNTVRASSGDVSGTATVTVRLGALATITVTPNPVTLPIGGTQLFTAVGRDAQGNVIAITPSWSVAAGGGTINGSGTFIAGTVPGTYTNTVVASSGGISGKATVTVTNGALATITVTPNPVTLPIRGTQAFTAVGTDAGGNVVSITPVWSVVAGGGAINGAGLFTAGVIPGTYANTVQASSGGISGRATVTVTIGTVASITVTPNPVTLPISGTQQFTAVGRDAGGNIVALTPTWSVVSGGGTISAAGLFTAGTLPGTFTNTVVASSGGSSGSATVTVTTGALASISVTPSNDTLAINGTQSYVAVGKDAGGNVVAVAPSWSVVAGGGTISGAGVFTAGTLLGTFTNTVTATSGGISATATVTVSSGALASITVTPVTVTLPISGTQQYTAVGKDAGGNVVPIVPVWTVVAGGGAISGTGLFTAGVVPGTFTNTVQVSSGGVIGTASVTVTTGALAAIALTPDPATLTINGTQQFTAVGTDAGGNVVAITPTWAVIAGGGAINGAGLFTAGTVPGTFIGTVTATSGAISADATVTVTAGALALITVTPNPVTLPINGTLSFNAVGRDAAGNAVPITPTWSVVAAGGAISGAGLFTAGTVPGTYLNTVQASSGGISGTATVTVTSGVLATIAVTPSTVTLPINGTQTFVAVGKDASGNVVALAPTWSVVAGGGTVSAAGVFTAGTVPGTFANTVSATSGGITGTASVTVTSGTLTTITVTPNPATLAINGVRTFTAVGTDASGNVIPLAPAWTVVAGGGTISAAGVFTAGTLPGTFTNTVTATSGGITGTATVVVTTGALATVTVTPAPATLPISATQQFTAVGRDAGGNVVAITPVWSVVAGGGAVSGAGLFTAGVVPGTFTNTVRATSGGIAGTATVLVTTGALTTITVAPNPATLPIGGTQQFTAVGRDAGGNVVTIAPTWSVASGGGAITSSALFTAGNAPGTFTNTVTATSGAVSGRATVIVTLGALTTITVTPNPAALSINGTQQFTAVGRDAGGNVVAITPTWSLVAGGGALNGSGLFTAGTVPGTFANTVRAVSGSITGTATVTVSIGPLATITLTPNAAGLPINGTQAFTAVGRDAGGNVVAITPAWSVVAGGGAISGTGVFTAGVVPGTFTNTVVASSGGITATATVTVSTGALATIAVTPNPVTLAISGTQAFTAVGRDAGGNLVAITPSWSVVGGGGGINGAGLFTAGTAPGTFINTVVATSGGVTGAATVVVIPGALAAVTVTPSTSTLPINGTQQFTAVGTDAGGNVIPITPVWSVAAGGGAINGAGLFTAGTAPGTYTNTVVATAAGLTGRASVTVTTGVLATISVTPNAGSLAINGTQQYTAVGRDAGGNVVAITPSWSVVAGGGVIGGGGLFVAGTVPGTFTNTVTAVSGGVTGTATVTVTTGALATITVTPSPVTLTIGGAQQFTAVGRDAGGNLLTIAPAWTVVAGGGTIGGAGLFTAGTLSGTFINTVTATSGGVTGAATVTVTTGALATISVTPNPVSLPISGTQQFSAVGRDAGGNVVALTPSWSVAAGGGSIDAAGLFTAGTVPGVFANTVTATSGSITGVATVTVTIGALASLTVTPNPATLPISGTQQFTAVGRDAGGNVVAITPTWSVVAGGGAINGTGLFTAGTVPGSFTNTVTALSGGVTGTASVIITTGPLATITVTPNSGTATINGTQQYTAVGRDAGGNVVAISPAWAIVAGGGTVDGAGLFTAGTVPGTFTNTVRVTSGGITGSASVTVTTGALASITVTPNPVTLPISGTQQFTAVGRDAGGNIVTVAPSWSMVAGGGIDGAGLFTAGTTPGTFTNAVTATSGGITGTATVTITTGVLTTITVSPSTVTLPTSGTQQFTAVGRDAGGNVVSVSPAWTVVAGGGSVGAAGLFTAGMSPGTFTNTVQATSGGVTGTATVTVVTGALTTITVTPNPVTLAISGAQQFTAVGTDVGGNVITLAPTWSVAAGGGVITGAGLFTAGTVPGTYSNTVTASSGGVTGTATVSITAGPLATITVSPSPVSLAITGTQQFTAVGRDAGGNVLAIVPVWSIVAGGGIVDGVGLFTAGTVPGTFTNTVNASSGGVSGQATVVVTTGALATITVTPNPATLTISGTQQFTAVGRDAGGNVVALSPTWSVAASGGTISGAGLFTAGTVPGTFTNTVQAASGAITGNATVTVITGALATITVTPAPVSLSISSTQQFTAVGRDAGGNVVALSPTWSVVASGGTISGAGMFTAGTVPGTFIGTVRATSGSITGSATVTVTAGALATITVTPDPVSLAINGTQQFTAVGRDAGGNVVALAPSWSVVAGGGTLDGAGLFTAGSVPGTFTNTVRATSGGIAGNATVTVTTGALASITVTPNPVSLVITGTQPFTAVGRDAGGNIVALSPTWSVVAGGGAISGAGLFTAGTVPGTFTNTVQATSGSITGNATVTVTTGAVATITVSPNPVTLAINGTQQFTAVGRDAGGNVVAIAAVWTVVAGGGAISGAGLFTAATAPGTYANTVRATSGAILGSATVIVTTGALTTITVSPNPVTLSATGTQQFTAVGTDAGGNVVALSPTWSVTAGGGTINGAGLFTAGTVPGTYTNTATATSGGISGSATVTVVPGALASITVTPNAVTLPITGTQQFTAVGTDASGNVVAIAPTWSVVAGGGAINGSGLFAAGNVPGTFSNTVQATSGGITGSATVTVGAGVLATITVTPSPVSLSISGTQQFTAVGRDAGGNVVALSPTWSVASGGGTITGAGLFTAGTTPGTFTNTVTATSGSIAGTATVTVTTGPLATITVSPNPASMVTNGSQQFSAVGTDAGGNVVAFSPTWSVVAGGGTISGTGLFTAGFTAGTFTNTVRATSGSITGSATVIITAAPPAGPSLGAAASNGIVAGSTITCVGTGTVGGDMSVSPGTAITGFPPCIVAGTTHAADAAALAAQSSVTSTSDALAAMACTTTITADLGGTTLLPGVHCGGAVGVSGVVTLNGNGNSNAVFVVRASSTLTTAGSVVLQNGAKAQNVFWWVGTSATLGAGSAWAGNVIAQVSITFNDGTSLSGRALARSGAVTLGSGNTISLP